MPDSVESTLQSMELPSLVELFQITYQGTTTYWTNSLMQGSLYWDGIAYTSLPIQITGIAFNETNSSETPKLQLTNVKQHFTVLLNTIPNMKGATVVYLRTFESYIGFTPEESSSLFLFKRFLRIDKLLSKTAEHLVYECGTLTSFKEMVFPRRQMLRDGRPQMRFEGLGINKQK